MKGILHIDNEEWALIPGLGPYEASTLGRIRRDGRVLRQYLDGRGNYLGFSPSIGGKQKRVATAQQVLAAFVGPKPGPDYEVRHLNGNSLDNRSSNLAWGTRSENVKDTVSHGNHRSANKTECPAGHPYDRVKRGADGSVGKRYCSKCQKSANERYTEKKRADA